jgi:hypothetical protein
MLPLSYNFVVRATCREPRTRSGALLLPHQARLDAIRFLNAAIKQREIELRETSGAVNDQEVIKVG